MQQIREMLKKDPEDPFLNYALAMEYVGQNNDDEAINILESLHKNHPDYTATYYHLAQAYIRTGKKEDAVSMLKEGISVASAKRERHALSELQSAYNELIFEDYD